MTHENPFKTVYKGDFIWPYIAPITFKPSKPPTDIGRPPPIESSLLDRALCQCDRHNWSPHFARAKHLKEKERAYREAMLKAAAERTILENEIIQHPCADSDDVISSMYKSEYSKRDNSIATPIVEVPCQWLMATDDNTICTMYIAKFSSLHAFDANPSISWPCFPVANYRSMKMDHEDPTVTPVAMLKDPKTSNYRDTTSFKHIALQPVDIQGPRPIDFSSSTQPPVSESSPYGTEYSEKISKAAIFNVYDWKRFHPSQ